LSRFWLILSCLLASACTKELSISDGLFYCIDDFECKPGYGCDLTINTCVLINELPETQVFDTAAGETMDATIDTTIDATIDATMDAEARDVATSPDMTPDVSDAR
jgi:hypothetical protein